MSTTDPFAIVGLTGGIASGKSTVSQMFSEHGVPIIDADVIAREIVEPGEPALEDIRETFGEEMLTDDGRLDRERLGSVVFDDDDARAKLDAITHPRIAQRMQQKAAEARESGARWAIYDAALIFENGLEGAFDCVVVVAAAPETQLDRIVERDGISRGEAKKRLDAQMPLAAKVARADYVIDNNGTLEETRSQVDLLYETIERGLAACGSAAPDTLAEHDLLPDELTD